MSMIGAKGRIPNLRGPLILGEQETLSLDKGQEFMSGKTQGILTIHDTGSGTVTKIKLPNQDKYTSSAAQITSTN